MRRTFGIELHKHMQQNKDIVVVTGDLGYGLFDMIRLDFADRFINVGAAEQTMMGVAVGLALSGKIPVVYSITPFLLYRPFETIRNYVDHEGIPVKLIGSGRDKDYSHDGFSHHAQDDRLIPGFFPNISCHWPEAPEQVPALLDEILYDNKPHYLNLKR